MTTKTDKTYTPAHVAKRFVARVKIHGETTMLCEYIWTLYHNDANKGLRFIADTVHAFGTGGEHSMPYKAHSSFKTLFARTGSTHEKPEVIRWKRTADAVVTDFEHEYTKISPNAEKPDTNKASTGGESTGSDSTSTVEAKPVTLNSVKSIIDLVMDKKPKRMKVTSIIIGLMSQVSGAGLAEIAAAVQKRIDAETVEELKTQQAIGQ